MLALTVGLFATSVSSLAAYTGVAVNASSFASSSEHYGCALGGTVVKSVQQGTFTMGGGAYGAPVTLSTTSNSSGQSGIGDAWFKITLQMQPTTDTATANAVRVLRDGAALNPTSGWTSVTSVAGGGTISLSSYNVPTGGSINVDDVVARKLVIPEPTVSVAAESRV